MQEIVRHSAGLVSPTAALCDDHVAVSQQAVELGRAVVLHAVAVLDWWQW
jgi:hypothetical protein